MDRGKEKRRGYKEREEAEKVSRETEEEEIMEVERKGQRERKRVTHKQNDAAQVC